MFVNLRGGIAKPADNPEEEKWKAKIGDWYRWTAPNGQEWDAADIAISEMKNKITFFQASPRSDNRALPGHSILQIERDSSITL